MSNFLIAYGLKNLVKILENSSSQTKAKVCIYRDYKRFRNDSIRSENDLNMNYHILMYDY